MQEVASGAAVLFRCADTEQTRGRGLEPEGARHTVLLEPLVDIRLELVCDESPYGFSKLLVFRGEELVVVLECHVALVVSDSLPRTQYASTLYACHQSDQPADRYSLFSSRV
jgi:hypothetical protein